MTLLLAIVSCTTTTTCRTCFEGHHANCERWSGSEDLCREITVRKLCEGDVPAAHTEACARVLEAVSSAPRVVGGGLKTPLEVPAAHFDVECSSTTKFAPLSGCGGFQ